MSEVAEMATSTEARWRNYQQLIWTQQQIQLQIQQQQQYQNQNTKMNPMDPRNEDPLAPTPTTTQQLSPSEMPEKPEEPTKETADPWENFDAHAAFLGPTLWDKRLPYDGQDFKLEYVDLEEFLTENGIPMDPATGDQQFGKNLGQHSPVEMGSSNGCIPQATTLPVENHMLPGPSRIQGPILNSNQMRNGNSHAHRSRSPSPCDSRSSSMDDHDDMDSDLSPDNSQSGDMDLGSIPGREFDPRTRSFTEDELKPQPMVKKSRKQFVPDASKDAKYWARRRKNNMAAKRSRDARRMKENQIAMRACFLEKENQGLKQEIERIQKENSLLKEQLRCCRRDH